MEVSVASIPAALFELDISKLGRLLNSKSNNSSNNNNMQRHTNGTRIEAPSEMQILYILYSRLI